MRIFAFILVGFVLCSTCAASLLKPVIVNGGFEDCVVGKVNDAPGWNWSSALPAAFVPSDASPHSGSRCLIFKNEALSSPPWWSFARFWQEIPVLPGVRYQVSAWVRGNNVGNNEFLLGLNVPTGTFGWRKVTNVFRTGLKSTTTSLDLWMFEKCTGLAIDDVEIKLLGDPIKGRGIDGMYAVTGMVDGHDKPAYLGIDIKSSHKSSVTLRSVIKAGDVILFEKDSEIKPDENTIEWDWNSGNVAASKLKLSLQILDSKGKIVASAKQDIEKWLPDDTKTTIARVEAMYKGEFTDLYAKCKAKNLPLDYPNATRVLAEQFIPYVHEDLEKNDQVRAKREANELENVLTSTISDMKAYLKDPKTVPVARKYQTSKVDIKGLSLIADRKTSTGKTDRGPVFFNGYGHFYQISADMPRWPDYGVNIVQSSLFGPSIVILDDDKVNLEPINDLIKTLDAAAKNDVRVDVLLSPHYFPDWALNKWPQLRTGGGGFFNYVVDLPEAKSIIGKFINTIVPMIKDHPALNSICLSNEPVFNNTLGAPNTKPMWVDYLKSAHGDIATLNTRYGTNYASFDDVPMCGNNDYYAPQFHDWCSFNETRFAGWHKWMADEIHKIAPGIPVHAKIMGLVNKAHCTAAWGVDLERFGALSDLNGNDNACWPYSWGNRGWGITWRDMNTWYDMQRSLNRKPIFNSENHISDTIYEDCPPNSFRYALWQGAVHGQAATTFWIWERTFDRGYPFYGNATDRPMCAHEVSFTSLDLNRFSDEVTALQNVKAPAAIVYSRASFYRGFNYMGLGYMDCLQRAYDALNFCGVKIDFISEKQFAEGKGSDYKLIILPNTTNLLPSTMDALRKLPDSTRLMIIGGRIRDPYGKNYPKSDMDNLRSNAITFPANADSEKALWPALLKELGKLNALPDVSVVDAKTAKPVWGVEWLTARVNGRTVVNIVNLKDEPREVKILRNGKLVDAKDLLSLGGRESVKVLVPIKPVLAEVR